MRKEHYANVIFENQNSPGKLWKVVKQMMGTSKSCKTSIKGLASGDTFVSNTKEIVNIFNTFFTNVGKNLAVKCKSVCTSIKQDRNVVDNSLKFNSVTPNNVCNQIQSLCSAKATGSDKISARLLKTAAPQISDSLCYVMNLSLKYGAVPKEWKHARVIPLYKYGKCDEASNYRPISVLPIISKIMERIVHDQLYKFIEENNILNKWQSGFRPGYSTETAITYVTDLLLTEMDSKKLTGVVFLNLKKAIDTVDHALLLTKLRNYGIRGDEHSWPGVHPM